MSLKHLLVAGTLSAIVSPAPSWAAPPVEVEVVVGGDDRDDFFEDEAKADASDGDVKAKSGTSGDSPNIVNTQTQVVNIHINGEKVDVEEGEAKAAPEPAPEPTATPEPEEEPELEDTPAVVTAPKRGWWDVDDPGRGDVILSLYGGRFKGLSLEGYLTHVIGLQADVGFDGIDFDDEDVEATDFVDAGGFGIPEVQIGSLVRGMTYMVDVGPRFHVIPQKEWDLYFDLGPSLFGYYFDPGTSPAYHGGSVYGRVGSGLRWHWKRLSMGVEFDWYPIEIARFESDRAEPDSSLRTVELDDSQRYRSDRYAVTWRVGFRF